MKKELTNAFGNVYLSIEVDLLNHWVHNKWTGHLTEEITKAGTEAYTKAVKRSGFNCVLNDSRQVLGRWDHSVEWALQEWVPQAVYAGIKYFALIVNPDSFSADSAEALTTGVNLFEIKIFDDQAEAEDWLRSQCSNLNL